MGDARRASLFVMFKRLSALFRKLARLVRVVSFLLEATLSGLPPPLLFL